MVSHRLGYCDSHRPSTSGDITYLIFSVTPQDHMIKGLCSFICRISLRYVTTLPCLVTLGIVIVEV